MLYLDNAATSRFKPQAVIDAINFDLRHSANGGRSGHSDAIEANLKIEACREYLKSALNAKSADVIFTKSCTEALNLALFGLIKGGEKVVTTALDHNSVLRPLFHLKNKNLIFLRVVGLTREHKVDEKELLEAIDQADIIVLTAASNVLGESVNLKEVGEAARNAGAILIVDGAQGVPCANIDFDKCNVSMLALAGHKGLHGVQGTGALVKRKDIKLSPLIFGGTGTSSSDVIQPASSPEDFEAGTQFAGGIAALHQGAKWSFSHVDETIKNYLNLTKSTVYNLKNMGLTVYSEQNPYGIVSFNLNDADSAIVAQLLDFAGIATRSGLHCAPLVHEHLGTAMQGAVRISFGVENTKSDVLRFSSSLEKIIRKFSSRA